MTKEKIIAEANKAGYVYDELESGKGSLRFFQVEPIGCGMQAIYFKTWKEAAEWVKNI